MQNPDTILVERFAGGDTEAYADIVTRYAHLVYSACHRVTRDHAKAEDACQETFLQLVRKPHSVKGSLTCWLYTTATWKAVDLVRKDASQKERETHYRGSKSMETTQWSDLSPCIDQALLEIPEPDRALILDHFLNNRSQGQLASEQGVNQSTVSRKIDSALKKLRANLERRGIFPSLTTLPILLSQNMVQQAPQTLIRELEKMTILAGAKSAGSAILGVGGYKLLTGTVLKMAAISALIFILGGTGIFWFRPERHGLSHRGWVRSVHFIAQSGNSGPQYIRSMSKGAYEQWYYFPEGSTGPMFLRMQRWDSQVKNKLCSWLQNEKGSYYFNCGVKTVYIQNSWLWLSNFRVRRLPTDSPEFCAFLDQTEGQTGPQYARDEKTGYVIAMTDDNRFLDVPHFHCDYRYNEIESAFFAYNWSGDIKVVDERDSRHRRGWTYFRVTGQIDGRVVQGSGRIPLVYAQYATHFPWLQLTFDNQTMTDSPAGGRLCDKNGTVLARYPRGTFFKGLMRPWMGMHTIDLIRRDAAEQRIPFMTLPIPSLDGRGKPKVFVFLSHSRGKLGYAVDLEGDLIDSITIADDKNKASKLEFSYPDRLDSAFDKAPSDTTGSTESRNEPEKAPGLLWLFSTLLKS